MYYVEKLTYFIEESAIPVWIEADQRIWDPWLIQQAGVVRKEIWLDPQQPFILKIVITWFSIDEAQAVNMSEVARLEGQMAEAMSGYVCEEMDARYYYSKTTIENNAIDADEDQDDDDALDDADYDPSQDSPAMVTFTPPTDYWEMSPDQSSPMK